MKKIYQVCLTEYDGGLIRYVIGPNIEDFQGFCHSLVDEAITRQIDLSGKECHINDYQILNRLLLILAENGYDPVELDGCSFVEGQDLTENSKIASLPVRKRLLLHNTQAKYLINAQALARCEKYSTEGEAKNEEWHSYLVRQVTKYKNILEEEQT